MKPERNDIRHQLLICGDELVALQRLALGIAESFGLDRKIEKYKGARPLTLLGVTQLVKIRVALVDFDL